MDIADREELMSRENRRNRRQAFGILIAVSGAGLLYGSAKLLDLYDETEEKLTEASAHVDPLVQDRHPPHP
jgi:hypothetical protein